MIKKIFFLSLLVLPLSLFSQRFKGGILLGLNASQIDGDSWYGYNKAGLVAGAFVFTDFGEKWSAQMEIRYSGKGSASSKRDSLDVRRKFSLRYIEIPVMAKFDVFKYLQLQGGVSFGYLFYAGQDDGYGYEKLNEMPKPIETALSLGIDFSYFKPLHLNLRYSYSVLPVYEGYAGASYGYGEAWFNNVITLAIYYHIGKDSKY
jgi:hypothetical protein